MAFEHAAEVEVIAAPKDEEELQHSGSRAAWLAWSIWALSVTLIVATMVLAYQNDPVGFENNLAAAILDVTALTLYATVGALIASRHRENPIGWIFCVAALLVAFGVFAEDYAQYALVTRPGSLPGGVAMAWLTAWPRNIGFVLIFTFLLLLFPNGKLPSRRWRAVAWLAVGMIVIGAMIDAFKPGPLSFVPSVNNPLGIEAAAGIFAFNDVWNLIVLAIIIACILSVIARFRHAKGQERQQLKWFAYAAVLAIVQFAAGIIITSVPTGLPPDSRDILLALSVAAFPIAAGIAILRYRLYDIDLLINRTLVYVPLTGILAGVYSASIALFQKLFVAITREQSDAAIVITTLILASSFTPIKNGLQGVVDKRFKEAPDPIKRLRAFGDQVRSFVQLSDAEQLRQRLLDEVVSAFDATGGAIYPSDHRPLTTDDRPIYTSGAWTGNAEISIPLSLNGEQSGSLSLGPRRNGFEYTVRDLETLQETVDVVAQAVEVERRAG
jgi:hypothetical protein